MKKTTNNATGKFDIYTVITDRIIAELEKGVIPWRKPWTTRPCVSHLTGKPYSLLNQMLLVKSGEYLTFKQVQDEGGKVKKGAKASPVTFWTMYEKKETDPETGEEVTNTILVLRYYNVFHIGDCEGITPKYTTEDGCLVNPPALDTTAEKIITNYKDHNKSLVIEFVNSNRAYYMPSADKIVCPEISQFAEIAEYYSTAFHEMTHSTGHTSRLARKTSNKAAAFGSKEYSKEELIAEIGAASLVNIAGLETPSSFKNSAAYVKSWLAALKNDKKMIVHAASAAEKAINYILEGLKPSEGKAEPTTPELVKTESVKPNGKRTKGEFKTLVRGANGPEAKLVKGYIDTAAALGYYKNEKYNQWYAVDLRSGSSVIYGSFPTLKETVAEVVKTYATIAKLRSGAKYDEYVKRFELMTM